MQNPRDTRILAPCGSRERKTAWVSPLHFKPISNLAGGQTSNSTLFIHIGGISTAFASLIAQNAREPPPRREMRPLEPSTAGTRASTLIGMTEIWLRSNRRIFTAVAMASALAAVLGGAIALGIVPPLDDPVSRTISGVTASLAAAAFIICLTLARQPRLAYCDGRLLVSLRRLGPFGVPIEFVEAFLLGQGPSWLAGKKHRRTETTTLVIRLADRAVDWSHRDVDPVLGSWCDGYITIRGTWCEPLSLELVNRLNLRLHQVTRAKKNDETVGQRA